MDLMEGGQRKDMMKSFDTRLMKNLQNLNKVAGVIFLLSSTSTRSCSDVGDFIHSRRVAPSFLSCLPAVSSRLLLCHILTMVMILEIMIILKDWHNIGLKGGPENITF